VTLSRKSIGNFKRYNNTQTGSSNGPFKYSSQLLNQAFPSVCAVNV